MRKHYDFSKAKKNPYAKRLKQSVTIRLDFSRRLLPLTYVAFVPTAFPSGPSNVAVTSMKDASEARQPLRT